MGEFIQEKIAQHWGDSIRKSDSFVEWKKRMLFKNKSRIEIIKRVLKRLGPKPKILEVGCGPSNYLLLVKEIRPDAELYGIDISKEAVEVSKKKGVTAHLADQQDMPFPENFFDLVLSFGVVEHYVDPQDTAKAIREHIRVTKKYAYINVPNKCSLIGLEYKIGNRLFRKRSIEKQVIEDGQFYSSSDMKKMAETAGSTMSIEKINDGNVLPLYKYLKWIDYLLPSFVSRLLGSSAGIIINKN